MWPYVIVLFEPHIDDDLSLIDACKPFGVQNFISQCAIEPFIVAVLPRAARVDLDRLDADLS